MVNNGRKAWKRELRTRWTSEDLGSSEGIVDEIEPLLYPFGPAARSITWLENRERGWFNGVVHSLLGKVLVQKKA